MPADTPPVQIPEHTLLQRIGGGSYGDIWLARNALGEFRAVKLIFRDRFEDARPFERELEGIRRFEPVSRKHPGVIDILQVGQDENNGIYYYIMEPADDQASGPAIDPENYEPRTLRADLQSAAPLPPAECIAIARAIAAALCHLHSHDLVHRDIKPSNILFIENQPRLADIGLVAAADATLSLVGTLGYIPREGPGKPSADLYSLGKVLYEMATGKDRAEFPEIDEPSLELRSLNKVILKACHEDPVQRYADAGQMIEDLDAIAAGQPPPHAAAENHAPPRPAKLAMLAGMAVGISVLAWMLWKPASTPAKPKVDFARGLIALYPLDGNVTDTSGQNRHGQLDGALPTIGRHGEDGGALALAPKLAVSLPPDIMGTNDQLTLSIWARLPRQGAYRWPRFVGGNAADDEARNISLGLQKASTRLLMEIETESSQVNQYAMIGNLSLPLDEWFHAVMVYDGQRLSEYVNGQPGNSIPATGRLIALDSASLGSPVNHFHFTGSLDQLRVYHRALSPAEVAALYASEKPESTAAKWDFKHVFLDVSQPGTMDHMGETVNARRHFETAPPGFDNYLCAVEPGKPATVTYQYTFQKPVREAHLRAVMATYNFGETGHGYSSLWASNDGENWTRLLDGPTPKLPTPDAGHYYERPLPKGLTGTKGLWIQARLHSEGREIFAQFLRHGRYDPLPVYSLRVKLAN